MSHRVGVAKSPFSMGVVALLAAIAVAVLLIWVAVRNLSLANTSEPGVYRQLTVGETEEMAVRLPPRSWWDLDIDKPVIIRLANGEKYERRPDGLICKNECVGEHPDAVSGVGDRVPGGVIYLHAKKGGNMAKVTITTARKAPAEANPPAV